MSRIGKKPVAIPSGIDVKIDGRKVTAKGSKGELSVTLVDNVTVELTDDGVVVSPVGNTKRARSMWGMSRTLIENIITGVSEGFTKHLQINGVGYRAQMKGKNVGLQLGLSHDVVYQMPEGVSAECPTQTEIVITGIDKQAVGQAAAEIRSYRPPEPYKGKGIKYKDEYIFRKEGKKK
ncbi:MAG: 50S ribosomal protein L6 [Rhodomicrobium sp.]|nr:MAG: 50S ribosomal protein L6 [Rhodomicrobium sp.]